MDGGTRIATPSIVRPVIRAPGASVTRAVEGAWASHRLQARPAGRVILALLLLAASGLLPAQESPEPPPPEPPPVVWEEWSDAVFARARTEVKGVLLTIVTPWCKPCATADLEVYADPVVRRLVERWWIPVRVDAMERPDLDSRYRLALWVLAQQTGYPVTAFLFPTGEAMWVDGFIPAEDRETRKGLRTMLVQMNHLWKEQFEQARQNALAVQKVFDLEGGQGRDVVLDALLVASIADSVIQKNDAAAGGYGAPPRRQNAFAAELVLLASRRRGDRGLEEQALEALRAPIRGAVFDRLQGGFHMGAADPSWEIPLFEKLLSVNAAYLHALVQAVRATGDEEMAAAAAKTVDYMMGTLGRPSGGFFAMQAPAAPGEDEASYYSWTVDEVRGALDPQALSWAEALFGLTEKGDLLLGLPPRVTLKDRRDRDQAIAAAGLEKDQAARNEAAIAGALAQLRARKTPPPVLEREYLDATSMACSALLQAAPVLGREDAADAALAALDRILKERSIKDGVPHRLDAPAGSPVLMVDQAWLGLALLDAHESTGRAGYLDAAVRIAKTLIGLFDSADGAFHDVVEQKDSAGYVRLRRRVYLDSAQPSPQVIAGRLLERVGYHTGDQALVERAAKAYRWTAGRLPEDGLGKASLALAVDAMINGPVRIHVGGRGEAAEDRRRTAFEIYEPSALILSGAGPQGESKMMSACLDEICRDGLSTRRELEDAIQSLRAEKRARSRIGTSS